MMMKNLFLLIVLVFMSAQIMTAQVFVPLRLDRTVKATTGISLFCDKDYNCGLLKTENEKTGLIDKVINIKVKRIPTGFEFLVDKNLNGKLQDETPFRLLKNSETIVEIARRSRSGVVTKFPFVLRHSEEVIKNVANDDFFWGAAYAFTGQLKYKKCSTQIRLDDMNRNGFPDSGDADRGTNFGLDRNNDGKFWGADEHHHSNEIIEFCGQNFFVSTLKPANATLTRTNLQIAKVGRVVPQFELAMLNGTTATNENLAGKAYVFDFWASWCKPCVANLPEIKKFEGEFKGNLAIFSINVDEASRDTLAKDIIERYEMTAFSSIRGLGEADELWKTFGGANLNRLSIPLYILVDKNKIIQYAGNGGENLQDLRDKIKEILGPSEAKTKQ